MKKYVRGNKGITLVALVITIVILLILAGIGIQVIINNNLLQNASNAKEKYNEQSEKEKLLVTLSDLIISKNSDPNYNKNEYINKQIEKDGMSINEEDIVTVNKYKFKIDRETLKITEELGKETLSGFEKLQASYVQDGLVCWYDGIYNTKSGHNESATTWEDLTANGNNGILRNINNTNNSGWTNNSIILDGEDDWIQMPQIKASSDGITVEIVAKLKVEKEATREVYITNMESGGIAIQKNSHKNSCWIYSGGYKDLYDDENVKENQIYSMSTGINQNTNTIYFSSNEVFKTNTVTSKYSEPISSTIFAIGTNVIGNNDETASGEQRPNLEVYSVRIYNRCLTQEEVQKNYEQDKKRFKIIELTDNNPTPEELGYVSNGLVCMYDGEYNSKYEKSSKTTTWYDLSRNNNEGILKNFNFNENSGWTGKSLVFDGQDDWVAMKFLSYDNMTIEIVTKLLTENKGSDLYFVDNYERGGIGIDRDSNGYMQGRVNVDGSYIKVKSNNIFKVNQKYSMTIRYDGVNALFRENSDKYLINKVGKIKPPSYSTIFALGANTIGNDYEESLNNNFEVYSVRIYNRALADDEIQQNYNSDKRRFDF